MEGILLKHLGGDELVEFFVRVRDFGKSFDIVFVF